jgi:glycosyltransferase involved in cell wall biosynthesis
LRITRIYNGLDYQKFNDYSASPPASFTFTYFGRLGISKGLELLIPAAARFLQEHPETRLQLIIPYTPAAMFQKVNDLVDNSGMRKQVAFRHELSNDELYRTISESSCIVIPSHQEGFCFVAAEAVALNVPIVSSGRGALRETVSGHYLELEDLTESDLLEALEKAYAGDYHLRKKRLFSLPDSVTSYQELYGAIADA